MNEGSDSYITFDQDVSLALEDPHNDDSRSRLICFPEDFEREHFRFHWMRKREKATIIGTRRNTNATFADKQRRDMYSLSFVQRVVIQLLDFEKR